MEENSSKKPIQIRDVLRPIWSRLWLIVICVGLATALTYYHYSSQPKQYRASTMLYIGSTNPLALVSSLSSDRETQDLATLANSTGVAELAAKELNYRGDAHALNGGVTASPVSGSDFVSLTAVAGSAYGAAALANATADAFVTTETNTVHQEAAAAIRQTQQQLGSIPNTPNNLAERQTLSATIQQMQAIETNPSVGIKHVDPAFPPGAPFAPNPKKNAIFAFVIVLMLTVAGAYGLEHLDRRVRKLDDVERIYGYPVLATVPRTTKPAPIADGTSALPDDVREAFRRLRTGVQLATISEPPKTIVVTSAVPREGKSTVTRNLALAYREAGLAVCVVDADLRRPSMAGLFGVEAGPGLTDVVTGDEPLWGALKHATVFVPGLRTLSRIGQTSEETNSDGHDADLPRSSDKQFETRRRHNLGDRVDVGGASDRDREIDSIVLLRSGPEPANPPVVLGSDRVRSMLSELAQGFDIVLIDTSPLLAVSDAVPLLSTADGVLLVTRLGLTTSDAAEGVVEQIRRIPGANLLGIVANDVHGHDGRVASYSYGYAYTQARPSV